jgi:hypothetical protein
MLSHKHRFRRLNLDTDEAALGAEEYSYLKNGVFLQNFDGHDWSIGSIVGNSEVANADLPAGTNTVIGRLVDVVGIRVFFCVHNTNNDHTIYQLDSTLTFTRVMRTSLFAWTALLRVDMDIQDDILILTDNTNEILKINVAKAIAGVTYTPTLEELTLIKRPPQNPVTLSLGNDATVVNNYVYGHNFQFYFRYIYEDNDPSVWGPVSPVGRPEVSQTTYNYVDLVFPLSETVPATVKQIDYAVRIDGANSFIIFASKFSSFTATVRFYNNVLLETVPDAEAFKWVDAVPRTTKSLQFFQNRIFTLHNKEGYTYKASPIVNFTATAGSVAFVNTSFKHHGTYTIGIMFFDKYGRHAGVHLGSSTDVTIPDRTQSDALTRYWITANLASVAQADIPTWATHYAIVRTKVKNYSWFLAHKTAAVFVHKPDYTTGKEWGNGVVGAIAGYYTEFAFDLYSVIKSGMGYTWQEGDRLRLYLNDGTVQDVPIIRQEGRLIFTRLSFLVLTSGESYYQLNFNFEIYRPKSDTQEIFYEVGKSYPITDAGTGTRAFSQTTVDLIGDCEVGARTTYTYDSADDGWDVINGTATDPFLLDGIQLDTADEFIKMNAYDDSYTVWAADAAWRPMPLNRIGSSEFQKTNYVRYGQQYFKESGVSNLNVFNELDEYPLPIDHGPGTKLQSAGTVLMAACQNKTTALYIGEGFVNTSDANNFLAKTDSVIGDDRPYFGSYGSIHPESFVEVGDRVYFYDMSKGVVVRRSNDGLTPISNYGVRNFIAKYSRGNFGNSTSIRMFGGWDPEHRMYVLSAMLTDGTLQWTLGFHEDTNSWVGFFDSQGMYAHHMGHLVSFKDGKLYNHGSGTYMNFYGVQKTRILELALAVRGNVVGAWKGLRLDAEPFYTDSGSNDAVITITNNGAAVLNSLEGNGLITSGGLGSQSTVINYLDLILREGFYTSAIFRDMNTPQPYAAGRAKFEGNPMRGNIIRVKIVGNKTDTVGRIRSLNLLYEPSPVSVA